MTTGFTSISSLKAMLLPEAMRMETTWDAQLRRIGLATVAAFEQFTARKFARVEDATFTRPADCSALVLDRYPVENISAVNVRRSGQSTDEDVIDQIANWFPDSGIVEFTQILGTRGDKLTVTFTGGFWWDDSDDASGGDLPSGATALPEDLIQAWMLQVQNIVERTRLLKTGALEVNKEGEYAPTLQKTELLPGVVSMLKQYCRFA